MMYTVTIKKSKIVMHFMRPEKIFATTTISFLALSKNSVQLTKLLEIFCELCSRGLRKRRNGCFAKFTSVLE